jgi:hypothetical protein
MTLRDDDDYDVDDDDRVGPTYRPTNDDDDDAIYA